ncbi:hypothetical protein RJT34_19421 [Clitoria ternatea]|uniref:Uncharacterized protein n=1 Tax=Clitoria ternatea TaxID=43366 RepID=A0AAN9IRA5_CLITE
MVCFRLLAPYIPSGIFWEVLKLWIKGYKVIVLDVPLLFEAKMDRSRADIVIDNTGSLDDLNQQFQKVLVEILDHSIIPPVEFSFSPWGKNNKARHGLKASIGIGCPASTSTTVNCKAEWACYEEHVQFGDWLLL